jgi:hypothetical protein
VRENKFAKELPAKFVNQLAATFGTDDRLTVKLPHHVIMGATNWIAQCSRRRALLAFVIVVVDH